MEFIRVASLAEIPEGELRGFELPNGRIGVAHFENEVFAFGDECPSGGCPLSDGFLDDMDELIVCASDESAFDIRSGEPVRGPAVDRVPVFPARIVDEWVEVAPVAVGRV
jgi:3-phenylpropionate/trans-cinnamate dioxygenase ferredoxin subunit